MHRKYVNDSRVKLAKVVHPEKDVKQRMDGIRVKGSKPVNHVDSAISKGVSIKRNRVDHAMSVNQRKIGRDGKFVSLVNLRASVRPSQLLKPKELRVVKRIKHLQLHNKTVPEFSGTVLFVKKEPKSALL
jgi:hypothetical protein